MTNPHEVISAFLDDEPVDSGQLAQALSEPDGRAMLLDLLALRHVVQPAGTETVVALGGHRRRPAQRAAFAAAAVVLALVGGYMAGQRDSDMAQTAPPATRVIEAPAAWQELP